MDNIIIDDYSTACLARFISRLINDNTACADILRAAIPGCGDIYGYFLPQKISAFLRRENINCYNNHTADPVNVSDYMPAFFPAGDRLQNAEYTAIARLFSANIENADMLHSMETIIKYLEV